MKLLWHHHEEPQATIDYLQSRGFIQSIELYVPRRAEPVTWYQACGPMESVQPDKEGNHNGSGY